MNCQGFWNGLPERGQKATDEQMGHLAECPACAAQWHPHRALSAGLHSLSQDWRKMEAPERVELGLTAAFRTQARFQTRRRPALPSWWAPVLAWASAAAAMIALAVVLIHGRQPVPGTPDTDAAPPRPAQYAPEVAMQSPTAPDADDESSALDEGFVRLPNAARIEPNEAYDVVRVAVPGSAMIALGLSVSEDRATETVLADVALGSDGTARAVRLVSDSGSLLE